MFLDYIIVSLVSIITTIIIIDFFFFRRFRRDFGTDRVVYCTEKQLGLEETFEESKMIEKQKENCESNLIKKEE